MGRGGSRAAVPHQKPGAPAAPGGEERDWKIRHSAAKALGALRASSCRSELEFLCFDNNPRVRKAARQALYLINRVPAKRAAHGA